MHVWRSRRSRVASALAIVATAACQGSPAAPAPNDPNRTVTALDGTGPVRIAFVSANVPPGGAIVGCGPLIEGCAGRLRIVVELTPSADGPVLYVRTYLHSMRNGMACLTGTTGPFGLQAGVRTTIEVALDAADRCGMPDEMATMDTIVEGPVQVASRQAWSIHYMFAP
jgi:hypothetical protein